MDVFQKMNQYGRERRPYLFILDYALKRPLIFTAPEIWATRPPVLFDISGIKNYESIAQPVQDAIIFEKFPIAFEQYRKAFDCVQQHIFYGNSFLVNLTQPTPIRTNLTLKDIFYQCEAKYKILIEDHFVVFSPEIFVKIDKNGVISSNPMKGTINADIPDAENQLLHDAKEMAEHSTIVDLIRSDLNRVGRNAEVKRFRYVEQISTHHKTLLQTSSEITGQLPLDFNEKLGDIFRELLPAGSISGAPKHQTLQIIAAAEGYERGYYTGVAGYFDGETVDSGVLIRFIENMDGQMVFKSGGGITAYSDAKTEYQELTDKVYVPIIRNPIVPGR